METFANFNKDSLIWSNALSFSNVSFVEKEDISYLAHNKTSKQESNKMRSFLSVVLFVFLVTAEIQAQTRTERVDSLNENEQLAYKMIDEQKVLQLYAQDINNHENVRLIGEWVPVVEHAGVVQFTNNRRNCFFMIQHPTIYVSHGTIFQYIGDTGEVRRVCDMAHPFRISRDGKFIVFNLMGMYVLPYPIESSWRGRFIVAVLSTESHQLLSIFDWTVNKNWGGGFMLLMDENDNIMNVYHLLDGGYKYAHAVIHLDTLQFEILWDITDEIALDENEVPKYGINEFQYDDFIINNVMRRNNYLRLDNMR